MNGTGFVWGGCSCPPPLTLMLTLIFEAVAETLQSGFPRRTGRARLPVVPHKPIKSVALATEVCRKERTTTAQSRILLDFFRNKMKSHSSRVFIPRARYNGIRRLDARRGGRTVELVF